MFSEYRKGDESLERQEQTDNNISLTSLTLTILEESHNAGENACAMTHCIYVGLVSILFHFIVSFH